LGKNQNGVTILFGLWVVAALAYAAWKKLSPFAEQALGVAATAARESNLNLLEKSLLLRVSTISDLQAAKDAGGLENKELSQWLGYRVLALNTSYDASGKLESVVLTLSKDWPGSKLASINNLKESLSELCGVDWLRAGEGIRTPDISKTHCGVLPTEQGRVELTFAAREPRAAPSSTNSYREKAKRSKRDDVTTV
jgi:hypothetical protein